MNAHSTLPQTMCLQITPHALDCICACRVLLGTLSGNQNMLYANLHSQMCAYTVLRCLVFSLYVLPYSYKVVGGWAQRTSRRARSVAQCTRERRVESRVHRAGSSSTQKGTGYIIPYNYFIVFNKYIGHVCATMEQGPSTSRSIGISDRSQN